MSKLLFRVENISLISPNHYKLTFNHEYKLLESIIDNLIPIYEQSAFILEPTFERFRSLVVVKNDINLFIEKCITNDFISPEYNDAYERYKKEIDITDQLFIVDIRSILNRIETVEKTTRDRYRTNGRHTRPLIPNKEEERNKQKCINEFNNFINEYKTYIKNSLNKLKWRTPNFYTPFLSYTLYFYKTNFNSNYMNECTLERYHSKTFGVGCQYVGFLNNEYSNDELMKFYERKNSDKKLLFLDASAYPINTITTLEEYKNHTISKASLLTITKINKLYHTVSTSYVDSNHDSDKIVRRDQDYLLHDKNELQEDSVAGEHVVVSNTILPVFTCSLQKIDYEINYLNRLYQDLEYSLYTNFIQLIIGPTSSPPFNHAMRLNNILCVDQSNNHLALPNLPEFRSMSENEIIQFLVSSIYEYSKAQPDTQPPDKMLKKYIKYKTKYLQLLKKK